MRNVLKFVLDAREKVSCVTAHHPASSCIILYYPVLSYLVLVLFDAREKFWVRVLGPRYGSPNALGILIGLRLHL